MFFLTHGVQCNVVFVCDTIRSLVRVMYSLIRILQSQQRVVKREAVVGGGAEQEAYTSPPRRTTSFSCLSTHGTPHARRTQDWLSPSCTAQHWSFHYEGQRRRRTGIRPSRSVRIRHAAQQTHLLSRRVKNWSEIRAFTVAADQPAWHRANWTARRYFAGKYRPTTFRYFSDLSPESEGRTIRSMSNIALFI